MGPQNLNNYYFNRLDAHIDYSSYYDFFLASDEKDYNKEVVYSKYPIGAWGNETDIKNGVAFPSNTLVSWFDLNKTGTTKYNNLVCNEYHSDNTLLSLSYWQKSQPDAHDANCVCHTCYATIYTGDGRYVTSICDVGLTGIDNSLVYYMSGDTGECDFCLSAFTSTTVFEGYVTGSTIAGTTDFSVDTWSVGTPTAVSSLTTGTFPNTGGVLTSTATSISDNFLSYNDCSLYYYDNCCEFRTPGERVYKLKLSGAEYLGTPGSGATATTASLSMAMNLGGVNDYAIFSLTDTVGTTKFYWVNGSAIYSSIATGNQTSTSIYPTGFHDEATIGGLTPPAGGTSSMVTFAQCYGLNGVDAATQIKTAVEGANGHNGTITVTLDGSGGIIFTQSVAGVGGNKIMKSVDIFGRGLQRVFSSGYGPPVYSDTGTNEFQYANFAGGTGFIGSTTFVAKTDIQVGYISTPCKLETLKLWETLPTEFKHDALHYDRRLKLKQITGYTKNAHNYNIVSSADTCAGDYQQLYGGFYQGFFKLEDYPYQVLPTRAECGWTVECLLKVRQNADICPAYSDTLNHKYPNNAGFFYYMGTRAENKFWNDYSGETGKRTCRESVYGCTGDTIPIQQSACTETHDMCGNSHLSCISATTYDNRIDVGSNSFGLRLTPDYRLGFRAIYYTGSCVMTGSCVTGLTYTTAFTMTEEYTTDAICNLTGSTEIGKEPWLLVSARFERDYCWYGCDLENEGGVNDLVKIIPPGLDAITSNPIPEQEIEFTRKWVDELAYRRGTLTLFVNGRPVLKVPDFEEVIPRRLNTKPELQVGVPYNMSWGGGSQGLLETLTFNADSTCRPYERDYEDLGLLIEKNFAGTFDGGISQMRYYIEPLSNDEIIHNYLVDKDRYNLIDCACQGTVCHPGRILYLTEGDSVDLDINFVSTCDWTGISGDTCVGPNGFLLTGYTTSQTGSITTSVDKLSSYITSHNATGIKFNSVITDNISSYQFYIVPDLGTGTEEIVNLPFCAGPKDVIKIIIYKINYSRPANMLVYGNLYR